MQRIKYALAIIIIAVYGILSFQARERDVSSIEGAPPIELIDGIRITTFTVSSDHSYLSFRLAEEQVKAVKEILNDAKFKKRNYLNNEQSIYDSSISFSVDIMANKTAYKMTVYDNSMVEIDDKDTYFITDVNLISLLLEYTNEQIGYSKKE